MIINRPARTTFHERPRALPWLRLLGGMLLVFCVLLQFSCTSEQRTIEKGDASLRLGDYTMAIRFFEEVLNRDPENFDARLGMGKAFIQQASAKNSDSLTWRKALTHLEAARSIRPENNVELLLSEAWVVHARKLLENRDTLEALNALSRAIDYNTRTVEALNLAGIIYFRLGEPDKAQILFERSLLADTTRSYAYFNLGMVRWSLGDIEGARHAWFKAVQLAPQDKDIVYWFSMADKKQRRAAQ